MPDTLPAKTLYHVLEHAAANYGPRPALSHIGDIPFTYSDFYEAVINLSLRLAEEGIGCGHTVVILGENSPNWGIAYFAITRIGAIAVPILTEFHPDAITHIIRHSEAKAIFVSEKLFPKIEDTVFDPAPVFISLDTLTPFEQGVTRDVVKDMKSAGLREFRKWMEKAKRLAQVTPKEPAEDDLASIIYTSGTTGHSKGVMLTHKNIVSNAEAVRSLIELGPADRMLSILPLAHTFECSLGLVTPVLRGAHVFYLDRPPTGRVLLPALAEVKPTVMLSVPLIMEKIYKNNILPKLTKNRLCRFLYSIPLVRKYMNKAAGKKLLALFGGQLWLMPIGGAPLAPDAERFLKEANFPFAIGYGLTESSPMLSGTCPAKTRLQSAGKAISEVSLRLADVNPQTGEGEIQANGPNIMKGYYKSPETTAEVFTADGWFKTGDLGYIDQDGYVYIKGRLKNMILGASGENIYPEEVESFFFASPYVAEVLVHQQNGALIARVYMNNEYFDEQFGNLSAEETLEKRSSILEDIRCEVNSKVSSFSRIRRVFEQAEPFEKTPTHKIKRYLYTNID